jgi:hypothetical protein
MAAQTRLDFCCDGLVAGYFIDMATYPTTPGRYRYVPYRGPGHLRLRQQFASAGFARCSWSAPDQQVAFVARSGGEYGFLLIEPIGDRPEWKTP